MTRPIPALAMVAALSAFSVFGCGSENEDPVPDGSTQPQPRFGARDAGVCVPNDPPAGCGEGSGGDHCEEDFGPGWRCEKVLVDSGCGWSGTLSVCVQGPPPDAGQP